MVFCLLLDSGVGRLLPAPGNSDYGRQADCCAQRSGQPVVRSNFLTVVIRIQIWIWFPSCFFLGKTSIINYCKLQFYSYVKFGEFWPLITWIPVPIFTFSLIYKVFNIRQENTGTDSYLTNMVQIYKHAVPLEYGAAARSYIPTLWRRNARFLRFSTFSA